MVKPGAHCSHDVYMAHPRVDNPDCQTCHCPTYLYTCIAI